MVNRLLLSEFLKTLPEINNEQITKAFAKAYAVINTNSYKTIVCSISGGADSDVMLDIIHKVDFDKKVKYVWFDTGLEYQATKDHLKYLENKYGIEIETAFAVKPIPITCKQEGQPFASKFISESIERLQKFGFTFEDKPYEELVELYPECKSAIDWWCNKYPVKDGFDNSMFNISYKPFLKEFLIENPPTFKISSKCCKYAKKEVSKDIIRKYNCDLMIIGIRKDEGGIRGSSYKDCFSENQNGIAQYRPLFWFSYEDKEQYDELFNIKHSACYHTYGFKRTGCCCCPYGKDYIQELEKVQQYEPKLYKAVSNVFKDSYEYTKAYREFRHKKRMNKKYGRQSLF